MAVRLSRAAALAKLISATPLTPANLPVRTRIPRTSSNPRWPSRALQNRRYSLFSSITGGGDLTPAQERIARLESEANAHPSDEEKQVAFFKELTEGGLEAGVVKRWEEMEASNPESVLMRSQPAFELYLLSLSRIGKANAVLSAVRRRDEHLQALISSVSSRLSSAPPSKIAPAASASSSLLAPSAPPVSPTTSADFRSSSSKTGDATSVLTGGAAASPTGVMEGGEAGTSARPIHVVMEESRQFAGRKALRSLGVTVIYAFIILTFASLALENTGLLKQGNKPAEFEPEDGKTVKFSDVLGVDEAKDELEEVVEFLRNPEKFSTLGGKLPKGVLLTGPPGTGKTLLARAVAGEAGVPFLFASGSSFEQIYVGVGAARIRELFALARKKAPAIIFIDELDAIGSKRSAKDQHYMKQTLNQLLVELDGFEESEGVIILGATNFPQSLDNALTRPGRFDRHVVVGLPDVRGRAEILKHHMEEVQFDVDVDPSIIARGCPGMSGADLRNLVNEAAIKASRDSSKTVKLEHFEWAKDRVLMGAERKSHFVTPEGKRMTAYHEAGHALAALKTPGAMPLHKVTIMPRGQALGITFQLPEADKDSYSRKELSASIDVALGGRAAEEMIFGLDDTTTGCSSDLQRATQVALNMVRHYGFSDKIGLVAHSDDDMPYLSGARKDEIESEVRRFVDDGWQRVKSVLKTHADDLHKLAGALVEYETLNLEEVRKVLRGEKLDRFVGLDAAGLKEQAEMKLSSAGQITSELPT